MTADVVTRPADTTFALATTLGRRRYRYANEADLQDALAAALYNDGFPYVREVEIGPGCRVDFMVVPGIGLEVKLHGSKAAVAAQLLRYAECPAIASLVLVTARSQLATLPERIGGKTLRVVVLRDGLL